MNAVTRPARRLLVEDFDAPPPVRASTPAAPFCPCARCAAEGRSAECPSASYDDGLARGRELRALDDTAAAEALTLELSDALARSTDQATMAAEQTAAALSRVVIAALAAALPATFARLAAAEARAIAEAVLPSLASEPAVTIDVAAPAFEVIRGAVSGLPRASQSRITLHRRDGDAGDDLCIAWSAGLVRRNHAEALARVMDTLSQFGLAPAEDDACSRHHLLETTTHG